VFAREQGLEPGEWLERRFGDGMLSAEAVGAAVAELAERPESAVWWVGRDGLEQYAPATNVPDYPL
jgi:hypothetical protein